MMKPSIARRPFQVSARLVKPYFVSLVSMVSCLQIREGLDWSGLKLWGEPLAEGLPLLHLGFG